MRFKKFVEATIRPAALAATLFVATAASAQSTTAAIQGEATPGDVVIIENAATGFSREVKPNKDGKYQLRNLSSGLFSVTIKHPDGTLEKPVWIKAKIGATVRVQQD